MQHAASRTPVLLLIEDEPDNLHTMEALLKLSGYVVLPAASPALALDFLRERKPDLVITDYMMPEMDGRALAEQLRGQPETGQIPIILLSAVTPGAGPWDAYLRKPVEISELLATVRRLLARPRN